MRAPPPETVHDIVLFVYCIWFKGVVPLDPVNVKYLYHFHHLQPSILCYFLLMTICQGWHHVVFTSWVSHSFLTNPDRFRSNKIQFYLVLLETS